LASGVGLSPSRLSRLFKQQTGLTLVHFRQRIALERFLQMYDPRHGKTLLATALAAGFGSYAQFHRVYKRVLRCSPREHARDQPAFWLPTATEAAAFGVKSRLLSETKP